MKNQETDRNVLLLELLSQCILPRLSHLQVFYLYIILYINKEFPENNYFSEKYVKELFAHLTDTPKLIVQFKIRFGGNRIWHEAHHLRTFAPKMFPHRDFFLTCHAERFAKEAKKKVGVTDFVLERIHPENYRKSEKSGFVS